MAASKEARPRVSSSALARVTCVRLDPSAASRMIFAVPDSGVKTPSAGPCPHRYPNLDVHQQAATPFVAEHAFPVHLVCGGAGAHPDGPGGPHDVRSPRQSAEAAEPLGAEGIAPANLLASFSPGFSDYWSPGSTLIERFSHRDVSGGCKMVSLAEGGR